MQWIFSIHDPGGPEYARMIYDWDKDEYHTYFGNNLKDYYKGAPLMIEMLSKQGKTEMDDKMTRLFISTRVVPSGRHNMGQILRENNLKYYHECFMLKIAPTCVMDNAWVEFIEEVK